MTSRNSLLKISRINFKKRFPFLVICFLICFFLMTVVTIFECIGIKENIEYYNIPGMPPGVIPMTKRPEPSPPLTRRPTRRHG